jgi:tetratricopeptide (TPR) repeat protein
MMQKLADSHRALGRPEEGIVVLREIWETLRKRDGPDGEKTLGIAYALAWALERNGDLDGAEELYRLEMEGCARTYGPDSQETLQSVAHMADFLGERERCGEGATLLRTTFERMKKDLGEADERTLSILAALVEYLKGVLFWEELAVAQDEAVQIYRRVRGDDHDDTLLMMQELGDTYVYLDRHDEGIPLHREVLSKLEKRDGPDGEKTLEAIFALAVALERSGDHPEAEVFLRRRVEGRTRANGPTHLETVYAITYLARFLRVRERLAEAEPMLLQAYERLKKEEGEPDRRMAILLEDMVYHYQAAGKPEKAQEYQDILDSLD